MGLTRLQNVSRQFGSQIVIDDVTIEFHTGEIVGLVGPNGAGKTTLFKLIAGKLTADSGAITRSKGLEFGYLSQEPEFDSDNTLHDEVCSAFDEVLALEKRQHDLSARMSGALGEELSSLMAEYDRVTQLFTTAGGYQIEQRLNEIVGGLGFTEADYSLPMSVLSGGQKCRVALAKLLLTERSFLLLDEPTNHLDIDAVRWLEKFLARHQGGAIVISHDRYLLDRIADRIVEVRRGGVQSYNGNYSTYIRTRETDRLTQERQYEKDRAFIEKEEAFIARFLAGQRSKEAQGRRTRLKRRIGDGEFMMERPEDRRNVAFSFKGDGSDKSKLTGTALRVSKLCKRFDGKTLFDGLSFQVLAGQRVGITGPNGTGKSVMLKTVLGRMEADGGEIEKLPGMRIGYYAQEAVALVSDKTVLDHLRSKYPEFSEEQARSLLGRFLFVGADVFKRLGSLSGGEQSRIRLLELMLEEPDMLILDEPTNHLDIPSREALEEALDAFEGTIITVSHDRYFLDRVVDRLLVMREGTYRMFEGDYSAYIEAAEAEEAAAKAAQQAAKSKAQGGKSGGVRSSDGRKSKPGGKFAKLTLEEIEARIAADEVRAKAMQERFGEADVYSSSEKVTELTRELATLREEITALEQAWLEKSDAS